MFVGVISPPLTSWPEVGPESGGPLPPLERSGISTLLIPKIVVKWQSSIRAPAVYGISTENLAFAILLCFVFLSFHNAKVASFVSPTLSIGLPLLPTWDFSGGGRERLNSWKCPVPNACKSNSVASQKADYQLIMDHRHVQEVVSDSSRTLVPRPFVP